MTHAPSALRTARQSVVAPIIKPAFRSPRRVTITLPFVTYQDLQDRADGEGRSLSNLAAFLLESGLQERPACGGSAAAPLRRPMDASFH